MLIEVRQKDEICLVRCEGHFITADQEYLRAKKDEIKGANCKKVLGVCPRFSIRGSRGGSFVINAVNGITDLGWKPLPESLWHRKVASVGRFRNPFHQERACYP